MDKHTTFGIGRVNIIKTSLFPKLIYRFNAITITIPEKCFVDIDKVILKFIGKNKEIRITKSILKITK